MSNFIKFRLFGAELSHADGTTETDMTKLTVGTTETDMTKLTVGTTETDMTKLTVGTTETDMTKLTVAFGNFAKTPKVIKKNQNVDVAFLEGCETRSSL